MDLTSLLALYGAALGTAGTLLSLKNYFDRRRDRLPDVRVSMREMVTFSANRLTGEREPSKDVLSVTARNHGRRRVTLKAFALVPKDHDSQFLILEPLGLPLPHDLDPGRDCSLVVETVRLARAAQEKGMDGMLQLRARFQDALGNAWESAPLAFDIQRWLKEGRD
jgi:hypothetical protein